MSDRGAGFARDRRWPDLRAFGISTRCAVSARSVISTRCGRGFALPTVVLLLSLVAAAVFLLTREAATALQRPARSLDAAQARYTAEAGFNHAKWVLDRNTTCSGYTNVTAALPSGDSYVTTVAPSNGSPVTISSTATTAGGAIQTYARNLTVFQPISEVLQPGPAMGVDTSLWDGANSGNNFGATDYISVNNAVAERTALIRFNLSRVPVNAQISSAVLELYLVAGQVVSAGVVDVHRASRAWVEGDKDGSAPPGGGGATYESYDGQTNWVTPGGDYESAVLASVTIPSLNPKWYTWDVTQAAKAWHSGTVPNYGLLVRASAGTVDKVEFRSSDHADFAPKLSITYGCACGETCIAVASDILLSTDTAATLGSLSFTDRDLVQYDPGGDIAGLFFAGAATTLNSDIAAVHLLANGHLVLAANGSPDTTLGGVTFQAGDLVDYDPVADAATLIFDGDALFTDPAEKIGSVHVLDNHNLILSTETPAILGGLSFTDRDLVEYDPETDTATLFFDGNPTTLAVDITAVHQLANGHLVLAADGNPDATLGGVTFQRDDLVDYDPVLDTATLIFDGNALFTDPLERITSVHIGPGSGSVDGSVAHWKLDEVAGSVAADSVGAYDGALTSSPAWVPGAIDGGLDFDGIDDYVDAGAFDVSGSGLTLMAWFNAQTIAPNDPRFISKADGTNASDAWWQLSTTDVGSDRYLRMRIKAGGITTTFADSTVILTPGRWTFVVGTYDNASGDMKLYVDGSEVASGIHAAGGPLDTDPGVSVAIGANGTAERFFDGVLDDARVYDRAVTATAIEDLYIGSGVCAATVEDDFESNDYSGSTGTLTWATDWLEINEADGPGAGDERVATENGSRAVRVRDNDGGGEGVQREANLSGYTSAALSFDFKREALDDTNDYATLDISSDGGTNWTELDRFAGPGNETQFKAASYNIGAYLAPNTRIRFRTSPSMGGTDRVWFDNIKICLN
ncbi:MAG: DNRLRE domain-containing protein [Gammaproteobacteria bacterium]|nr:DNRLRE domain-containing protein [Gammaproteobacteria bacterium]